MNDKKNWAIVALIVAIIVIIFLAIVLLISLKRSTGGSSGKCPTKSCAGCPTKLCPGCPTNAPKSDAKVDGYVIGGYVYPGNYPYYYYESGTPEPWDPDNFGMLNYIVLGSIFVRFLNGQASADLGKLGDKSKYTQETRDKLVKNKINALISVDVNNDCIPGDNCNPKDPTKPTKMQMWVSALSGTDEDIQTLAAALIKAVDELGGDGLEFDIEPSPPVLPDIVKTNTTKLFGMLKGTKLKSGKYPLMAMAVGDRTLEFFDYKGANPYLDYVNAMVYNLEFFPDEEKFYPGLDKRKLILGLGISSQSFTGIPVGDVPECPGYTTIINDWFGMCDPNHGCPANGVYPAWDENDPKKQFKYDFFMNLIKQGKAKYIYSQTSYLNGDPIPYLYFPENLAWQGSPASWITFNGFERIGRYAQKVRTYGYRGIFTWITSSDSRDAVFNRKIFEYLNDYPQPACGFGLANCNMSLLNSFGWTYQDEGGNSQTSLGYPSLSGVPYNQRQNHDPNNNFVLLRDGRALDSKGLLCDKGKYGNKCQNYYCGDWTNKHPYMMYSYWGGNSICQKECENGKCKHCDADTGRCTF